MRHKQEVHPGEHEAIVEDECFSRVQALLEQNRPGASAGPYRRHHALLEGLLYCTACECTMGHSHAKRGARRWQYYVCSGAQTNGRDSCPAASLPAGEIEQFVLRELQTVLEADVAALTPRQQRRLVHRVVDRVAYDGAGGHIVLVLRLSAGEAPRTIQRRVAFTCGPHGWRKLRCPVPDTEGSVLENAPILRQLCISTIDRFLPLSIAVPLATHSITRSKIITCVIRLSVLSPFLGRANIDPHGYRF